MSFRRHSAIAVMGTLAILAMSTWTKAQPRRWTPLTEPVVFSGNDMGFRIEWMNGRIPTGHIVVRINGQWVEAQVGEPPDLPPGRLQVPPPPPPPPPSRQAPPAPPR